MAIVLGLIGASAVSADPVPYGWAPSRSDWQAQAQTWISGPPTAEGPGQASIEINNYWGMRQDPRRPWKGTPRGDGYDGASQAGEAVFVDPRWGARAIAIELRDDYLAGAHTSEALAARLAAACVSGSGAAACPSVANLAAAIAQGAGRSADQDARLFNAQGEAGPALRSVMRALAIRELGAAYAPSDRLLDAGLGAVVYDGLDQSRDGFEHWRAAGGRAADVGRLESYLAGQGLSEVFPTWQILRTASDWKGCGEPFAVPPVEDWPNLASTLRLVREKVKPAVPGLEAKSAYRGPWLNVCTGGAERSAHREFWALDLVPAATMTRSELMGRLCPVYAAVGADRNMGLGFYSGVRFHIDTKSHRSWASQNRHPYGPCAADGSVNPPPNLPPPPQPWPPPPAPR